MDSHENPLIYCIILINDRKVTLALWVILYCMNTKSSAALSGQKSKVVAFSLAISNIN